jgi:hypothetical protein
MLAAAAALLAATLSGAGAAGSADETKWRVTITNLTPAGSQPLSPPLFVVHANRVSVWSVGGIASAPVALIAEDASNGPAETAYAALDGVASAFTGGGGPIPPGASRSYEVTTSGGANRLSIVTMLVNTNDGFTGLDSLHLRGGGNTRMTMAYDAGSERNNERAGFIPGPCCENPFVRDPEGALIAPHPGIKGIGDLDPAVYGWTGPVARIAIERL